MSASEYTSTEGAHCESSSEAIDELRWSRRKISGGLANCVYFIDHNALHAVAFIMGSGSHRVQDSL